MADVGTPAWRDRLARSLAEHAVDPDISAVIEQYLTDTGERWHVVIADGAVAVHDGPATEPTATLTTDRATAAAIADGSLSAQRAFLDGQLRLGGDVAALLRVTGRFTTS